jgi:hypothetical protein
MLEKWYNNPERMRNRAGEHVWIYRSLPAGIADPGGKGI